MAKVSIDSLASATLEGIGEAHREYEALSHGDWVWSAAEYYLTVHVARSIGAIKGAPPVTIESNRAGAVSDAGAEVPGPRPKQARLNGRCDLVVWWQDYTPRALIEIKRQPGGRTSWIGDVITMKSLLRRGAGVSSLQFGAFAYYVSAVDGSRKSAQEKVESKFMSMYQGFRDECEPGYSVNCYNSDVHCVGSDAWGASCLVTRKH